MVYKQYANYHAQFNCSSVNFVYRKNSANIYLQMPRGIPSKHDETFRDCFFLSLFFLTIFFFKIFFSLKQSTLGGFYFVIMEKNCCTSRLGGGTIFRTPWTFQYCQIEVRLSREFQWRGCIQRWSGHTSEWNASLQPGPAQEAWQWASNDQALIKRFLDIYLCFPAED